MESLVGGRRIRAFKATDAFAVEAYRASRVLNVATHGPLAEEIVRSAMRSGGAVVAAAATAPGGPAERRLLELARTGLFEGRYYLYLARRMGLIDLRIYRGLTIRQDVALRELDGLLRDGSGPATERAPPGELL
jgi:hypothetical protein